MHFLTISFPSLPLPKSWLRVNRLRLQIPFYDNFALQEVSFLKNFDDVSACNLWFGPPPPIKNPGYAYASPLNCLKELHESLGHPGVTRLAHYVKAKKLTFLLNDMKSITQVCKDCYKVKALFLKPNDNLPLIKATHLPLSESSLTSLGHFRLFQKISIYF